MRMLDLFSGIGGFALAGKWTWGDELDIVGFCEIEDYAQKVLRKNFPDVSIYEDITKLDGTKFKDIDLITGGFPCQDISIAGSGKGLIDEETGERTRSGLWSEMHRIISEVRPRYAIIENVPMLTIRGGTRVITDLAEIGYDAEWQIIGADEVGAWHRRKRIWFVAYTDNNGNRTQKHRTDKGWKKKAQRSQFKIQRSQPKSSRHSKDVPNTNSSRHIYRQTQEQPTEGRFNAFSKLEPSGTHERDVSNSKSRDYWIAEPDVGRVANGIPNRVDRLKGLGNAIVPQVAYEIMKRIK